MAAHRRGAQCPKRHLRLGNGGPEAPRGRQPLGCWGVGPTTGLPDLCILEAAATSSELSLLARKGVLSQPGPSIQQSLWQRGHPNTPGGQDPPCRLLELWGPVIAICTTWGVQPLPACMLPAPVSMHAVYPPWPGLFAEDCGVWAGSLCKP